MKQFLKELGVSETSGLTRILNTFNGLTEEEKKTAILYQRIEKEIKNARNELNDIWNDCIKLEKFIGSKQDELYEFNKKYFYNSLSEFVLNGNYQIVDFNESKEKVSGCYFLYQNNEIVYVGISVDINKRLVKHKRSKNFNHVKYISISDFLEAIKLESYFINKHKPKLNKDLGGYEERAKRHRYNLDDKKINYMDGWPDKIYGETPRSKRQSKRQSKFYNY